MSQLTSSAPIFVIGYLHSGTTMLRKILGNIPSIYSNQGETRFFNYLPEIRRRFPTLSDPQIREKYIVFLVRITVFNYGATGFRQKRIVPLEECGVTDKDVNELLERTSQCQTHEAFFPIVYDFMAEANDKTRWVEKTPTHLFHVEEICQVVPNAQFIELVRDPRATIASKKSRLWLSNDEDGSPKSPKANTAGGYDPMWDSLAWKSAIRASEAAHAKFPEKVLRVRYEDLVNDSEGEVKRICHFLNEPFQEAYLDVGWVNTRDEAAQVKRGIQRGSLQKWQTVLTEAEIAICQLLVRSEMNKLKYDLHGVRSSASLRIPLIMLGSLSEFFERIHKRWQLGGRNHLRLTFHTYANRFLSLNKS